MVNIQGEIMKATGAVQAARNHLYGRVKQSDPNYPMYSDLISAIESLVRVLDAANKAK